MNEEKQSMRWIAWTIALVGTIVILNNFSIERRIKRIEGAQATIADVMLGQARVAGLIVSNREDQFVIHQKEFEYLKLKIQRLEQVLMAGAPKGTAQWTIDSMWQTNRESTNQ